VSTREDDLPDRQRVEPYDRPIDDREVRLGFAVEAMFAKPLRRGLPGRPRARIKVDDRLLKPPVLGARCGVPTNPQDRLFSNRFKCAGNSQSLEGVTPGAAVVVGTTACGARAREGLWRFAHAAWLGRTDPARRRSGSCRSRP